MQDNDGGTALMWAAGKGRERVADLLLRHDAEAICRTAKATPR